MDKKKIVVIGLKGLPAFGGAATVGENIILRLKDDFDFTVLSISSHASLSEYKGLKQVIFKKVGCGGVNTFFYYIKCLNYVLIHHFDLVYLHHADSGYITPFLRLKYKVLLTVHEDYFHINTKFSKAVNVFFRYSQRLNVKYASIVVSVSQPVQKRLEDRYHRNVIFIPNGMADVSNCPFVPVEQRHNLLFIAGRIIPDKGLHLLLQAMKKESNPMGLTIAGDIDQLPNYKDHCIALSEGLNVDYLGMIKDKSRLFSIISHSYLFVMPTRHEAMSMILLEVASLRIPIIASDIDANKAVFDDDEILFFKDGDSDDLSIKIIYATSHYLEMCDRAEKAYEKLKTNYSWDSIALQYKALLDALLA